MARPTTRAQRREMTRVIAEVSLAGYAIKSISRRSRAEDDAIEIRYTLTTPEGRSLGAWYHTRYDAAEVAMSILRGTPSKVLEARAAQLRAAYNHTP